VHLALHQLCLDCCDKGLKIEARIMPLAVAGGALIVSVFNERHWGVLISVDVIGCADRNL
jgi:hypothetical protein